MRMNINKDLAQEQSLMLSPQMQQAFRLLQLPLVQLQQVLREEITQNPVLEEEMIEAGNDSSDGEADNAEGDNEELSFDEEFDLLSKLDDDWKEYFRQSGSFRKYSSEDEEKRRYLESSIVKPETLQENLLNQLGLAMLEEEEQRICEAIIGNIDDNGYLQADTTDIAEQLGASLDAVEKMRVLVQSLSPVGVGARNLRECLLIQLDRLGHREGLASLIVDRYLDLLGAKKYRAIAQALDTSPEAVQKVAEIIETLDPKPGRIFSIETPRYIIPDVFVEKEESDFTVIVNDDRIPHLRISSLYREIMKQKDIDSSTKEYIKEKIRSAQWLIRSISQRQQTISNITEEIISRQRAFFEDGFDSLIPLTMEKIASSLGIHESTVSRAIAGKYIHTPHGLFDMKFFFSSGITTASGQHVSAHRVKRRISQMIETENPEEPLSDQQIIENLRREGFNVARRTIAKYRQALGILPSTIRRKY